MNIHCPATSGVFTEAGNALSSCLLLMTLETQITPALLQELLMALRANDADGYKSWLELGIEELGRNVAGEVEWIGWCSCWLKHRETGLWIGSWE